MNAAASVQSTTGILYLAFELGQKWWHLGFTVGLGQRARRVRIAAHDLGALSEQIARAKQRLGLAAQASVWSCYEAGREAFFLHRYLTASGIENLVIDPSSPAVDRRRRRAKTDRIDLEMLLRHLVQYVGGDTKVWRVVRVPSVEAEDARHLHRELEVLKRDRTAVASRIRSKLLTQGVVLSVTRRLASQLAAVRLWDGSALMPGLRQLVELEHARWLELGERIRRLEKQRDELMERGETPVAQKARRLAQLRSLAGGLAWPLSAECFAYRSFENRRQVGAYLGLTPTPYDSGESVREQGISKAGNRRLRWRAVEAAWLWLRLQPDSQLSRWFVERYGSGGKRSRRIGIVALARKLMVALWRYVESGVVPEGAVLKP